MRKRTAIGLGIAVLTILWGCRAKENAAGEATRDEARVDTVVIVVEKPVLPKDSLLISFEKTPCFGTCPAYKIKVYQSGFATYEGKNFAERMGLYATRFSEMEIKRILDAAEAAGFREFDDIYDDPRITDLPSTVAIMVIDGERHSVRSRMGAPEKVNFFLENLAVSLQEKDWQPYSER